MICKCETLNITEKNDEQILVTVMRGFEQEASENESEGTPQPFPVEISTDIDVKLTTPRAQRLPIDFTVGDEGRILIDLKADRVKVGTTYGIEVTGQVNGSRWCAIGDSVIRITRTTERGPKQVKVDADPYEVTLWAGYVGDVVPRHLRDLDGYAALQQLLDAMGETLGKKADTEDVTAALKNISDRFREYVPTIDKGKAGGVATLDGLGKILAAQLNMPWRGNFEGNFQASDTEPGIWGIDNRVIGPKPLNGEAAHGVMLVFPDRYKTTIFLVGPPNGAAAGNAPEIYARRWMTGPKSWTNWLTTANFARKDDIPNIGAMSQAEAEAGTATSARTISAKTLKAAIEHHAKAEAGNGATMPLTRIADRLTEEGFVSPDDCKQSGIYENVAFPARATSIYDATGKPYDEPYKGYPGILIVAEIASGDEEYRSLVQMAVCEGEIAVRSIHFGLQPGSYRDMGSWRHFLSSYSLSEIFAKRIEVPMILPSSHVTATIAAASEDCSEHRIPIGVRRDLFFIAFSSVELAPADDDAEGIRHCSLQGFRFDNGDAVVRVKNSRDSIARVKVNIHAVFTRNYER